MPLMGGSSLSPVPVISRFRCFMVSQISCEVFFSCVLFLFIFLIYLVDIVYFIFRIWYSIFLILSISNAFHWVLAELLGFSGLLHFSLTPLHWFYILVEFCSHILDCFHHFHQPCICVFLDFTQAFILGVLFFFFLDFIELFLLSPVHTLNSLWRFIIALLNSVSFVHLCGSYW